MPINTPEDCDARLLASLTKIEQSIADKTQELAELDVRRTVLKAAIAELNKQLVKGMTLLPMDAVDAFINGKEEPK